MEATHEKEYDFMSNPHPHPLIFYRQGKPENVGPILCSICGESFRPPAFGCSEYNCDFKVHQSCIKLPNKIPNPFYSISSPFRNDTYFQTNSLSLSTSNNFPCNRCGQNPYVFTYICSYSGFLLRLDLPCAISFDPKQPNSLLNIITPNGCHLIRHFSHPHPLTLHLQTHPLRKITTIPICIVCEYPIKSSSTYYYCPQSQPYCNSYTFHPQCAELPSQIMNLHHPHPLFLFALPWKFNTLCANCKNECTNFFYSCPYCWDSMNLHVYCVDSFKHEHDFQILHRKLRDYECQLCSKSNTTNDFPWFCTICHLFAHKNCAIHQMSKHLHHHSSTQTSSDIIHKNRIQHFSHKQHMLSLCEPLPFPGEYRVCDGCMRCISIDLTEFYACRPCGFYLHRDCATLATGYDNPLLHQHELSMVYTPDFVFSCSVCLQYCHGFAYHCEECQYVIDIRCAGIKVPFTHLSHRHSLSDYNGDVKHKCKACGEELKHKKSVGCEECKFYLDLGCAHLPIEVRNRFDEHPLILTFGNDLQIMESKEEHYCDICEEERKEEEWFYYCGLCCFAAHPRCVLGEFPFLKSIQFEGHPHPLNWVVKKEKYFDCSACEKIYDGNLAFECRRCKDFNVHAFGECYQHQLTKGRINYIMPSLRYRSIPHYQHLQ